MYIHINRKTVKTWRRLSYACIVYLCVYVCMHEWMPDTNKVKTCTKYGLNWSRRLSFILRRLCIRHSQCYGFAHDTRNPSTQKQNYTYINVFTIYVCFHAGNTGQIVYASEKIPEITAALSQKFEPSVSSLGYVYLYTCMYICHYNCVTEV